MGIGTAEQVDLTVAGRPVRLRVCHLGLACCGIEVRAALRLARAAEAGDPASDEESSVGGLLDDVDQPALNVLLVAGTITLATAPLVRRALAELPKPRRVVAFGACAISGGPYWDSYAIVPGTSLLGQVDLFVPGCPPRPQDLVSALEALVSNEIERGAADGAG